MSIFDGIRKLFRSKHTSDPHLEENRMLIAALEKSEQMLGDILHCDNPSEFDIHTNESQDCEPPKCEQKKSVSVPETFDDLRGVL